MVCIVLLWASSIITLPRYYGLYRIIVSEFNHHSPTLLWFVSYYCERVQSSLSHAIMVCIVLLWASSIIGGLLCHCLVAWSPWFIFILYTYDYLYFILFSFQIVSSFVRDSSYHDMYYKGCGLLCAHKKSFNTAIPVRSLGPYMCVHYCTYIVHILV